MIHRWRFNLQRFLNKDGNKRNVVNLKADQGTT